MDLQKKVLVVTPRYPFDMLGACGQDRSHGILLLKKAGYDVKVITMVYRRHLELIDQARKQFDVPICPIVHSNERDTKVQRIIKLLKRLLVPQYWDGASFEYRDAEIQRTVRIEVETYKPDILWCDYSYLWPLYKIAQEKKIPIITRSLNYEPDHFLGKVNHSATNVLKYYSKLYGEKKMLSFSDIVFSITPKEKLIYEGLEPGKKVVNMPLRRLGQFIGMNQKIRDRETLHVCFMGANYGVHHMLQALNFILEKVNPLLQTTFPNKFIIHIIGGKTPQSVTTKQYTNVHFHGYVEDLNDFLADMDIALSPSLSGEGMQQKVFEPIVRGIPTITTERALAGYPFYDGFHIITASHDAPSFVRAFEKLIAQQERRRISDNAVAMARLLFDEELLIRIIDSNIKDILEMKYEKDIH